MTNIIVNRKHGLSRRNLIKGAVLALDPLMPWPLQAAVSAKRVIIAGAGLAGLTCAWELSRRGHEVVVLEAADRAGGHVRTIRQGFPDGLYADCGAEHFTKPGYDLCYRYADEFGLTMLPYPHRDNRLFVMDGRMVGAQERERLRAEKARYNQRERAFLEKHPGSSLASLYLDRYGEKITDEYQPFGIGLDALDHLSLNELLKTDGASDSAIEEIGSESSALHLIWKRRIVQMRGIPEEPTVFFRLKGGNQGLPDAFERRLGARIQKNSPVTAIRRGEHGVSVIVKHHGQLEKIDGEFLVCCMNAVMLRRIPVTPPWPAVKRFAISNVPYTVETRPIFQSRTKFWKSDGFTGNMEFNSPLLGPLWPTADEVATSHGILIGTAQGGVTAALALSVFQRYYPGRSADIEKVLAVDWSRDPWAMTCEARDYPPGQLHRFWPTLVEPVGRVFFAGAYCDNQSWGMEAATRSAVRAARAIHTGMRA